MRRATSHSLDDSGDSVGAHRTRRLLKRRGCRSTSGPGVALPLADLLPIEVGVAQPCSTLGVHPRLTSVQRLYQEGDAAFLTNVGTLVEPMSKAQYLAKEKQRPPSLFAHNVQVKVTQSMHHLDTDAHSPVRGPTGATNAACPSDGAGRSARPFRRRLRPRTTLNGRAWRKCSPPKPLASPREAALLNSN